MEMMRAVMEDSASVRQRKTSLRGRRAAGLRSLKMSVVRVLGTGKRMVRVLVMELMLRLG